MIKNLDKIVEGKKAKQMLQTMETAQTDGYPLITVIESN